MGFGFLVLGLVLCNSAFFGGLNLGAGLFASLTLCLSAGYLLRTGHKLTGYSAALLLCALVLCASFARSDDAFMKFITFCLTLISANLGLCLLAGQNRRDPGKFLSLLDVPRTVFILGVGQIGPCSRGVIRCFRNSGTTGKNSAAVAVGLLAVIPLLAILIPLLAGADAAFEGLLQLLPEWDFVELFTTLLFGTPLAVFLFIRTTALRYTPKQMPARQFRGCVHPFTVHTVLAGVSVVYAVYLISQLAYFSGGFSGILPEGYTAAEYARRGFFEMAWLCAINLTVMTLAVSLVSKNPTTPALTRLLCLFIGIVTLFLVASAIAKMFLYIHSYGLTRLRVLTQVIIFFLGITTVVVCVWLFAPKLPYMKLILITALLMGAAVAWTDVDTLVARYNVTAYQTGRLEQIDVDYLDELGMGAIPYIARLTEDSDPAVANRSLLCLKEGYFDLVDDFRDWNIASAAAEKHL